jgi:hypothetical protein
MEGVVRFAAPGIIVSAAVGAIILCALVLKYGFAADDEEEYPGDRARRVLATRLGHAVAAVCFAASAVLAVVILRGSAPVSAPSEAASEEEAELAQLRAEVGDLRSRMQDLTSQAPAPGAPSAAETPPPSATVAPSPESPSPARGSSSTPPGDAGLPARSGSGAARAQSVPSPPTPIGRGGDEAPAALPAGVSPRRIASTVRDVRLEIESWPTPRDVNYQVRLLDVAGRPVTGAELTIDGHAVDGAPVHVLLRHTTEPGLYLGRLPHGVDPVGLRLRVAAPTRRFELGLDAPAAW